MNKRNKIIKSFADYPRPLLGDWLLIALSLCLIALLFKTLWVNEQAATLRIRLGGEVYGHYSLQQNRLLTIDGHLGHAVVEIKQGQARFKHSPCSNQYCVHQGWLQQSHQAAICLPNQLSLELLGEKQPFDTLNY